jgi:hypothetical protein
VLANASFSVDVVFDKGLHLQKPKELRHVLINIDIKNSFINI